MRRVPAGPTDTLVPLTPALTPIPPFEIFRRNGPNSLRLFRNDQPISFTPHSPHPDNQYEHNAQNNKQLYPLNTAQLLHLTAVSTQQPIAPLCRDNLLTALDTLHASYIIPLVANCQRKTFPRKPKFSPKKKRVSFPKNGCWEKRESESHS